MGFLMYGPLKILFPRQMPHSLSLVIAFLSYLRERNALIHRTILVSFAVPAPES
jgi:hypothetical protein